MNPWPLLAAVAAAGAALLLAPWPRRYPVDVPLVRSTAGGPSRRTGVASGRGQGAARGWRRPWLLAAVTGAGAAVVLPGGLGWLVGVAVAVWAHRTTSGLATADSRRREAEARAQLPVLVELVAGALAAGAPVARSVTAAGAAWPGPAADRLATAVSRLDLGADPEAVWERMADDPALAPLGRALARSASSGAPVADVVGRLAEDLADRARGEAEDRARAVGVRAAVPLGLCLLPAFVLLGIVPLAAGLLTSLG